MAQLLLVLSSEKYAHTCLFTVQDGQRLGKLCDLLGVRDGQFTLATAEVAGNSPSTTSTGNVKKVQISLIHQREKQDHYNEINLCAAPPNSPLQGSGMRRWGLWWV